MVPRGLARPKAAGAALVDEVLGLERLEALQQHAHRRPVGDPLKGLLHSPPVFLSDQHGPALWAFQVHAADGLGLHHQHAPIADLRRGRLEVLQQ